jgi:hypothetical protein
MILKGPFKEGMVCGQDWLDIQGVGHFIRTLDLFLQIKSLL